MSTESEDNQFWTPANKVTFIRIILVPVFVVVLVMPWTMGDSMLNTIKPWLAALIFIALSATDALDGYLARSRGEVTDFGKFMDPLADKLLVSAALLGLIELQVLPSWVALIIIAREFIVSGVRMVAASKGEVIAASWYGKVKTVLQMIAIVLFIVKDSYVITDFNIYMHDWLYLISWLVMFAALVMTIVSMVDYVYKARYMLGYRGSKRSRQKAEQLAEEQGIGENLEEIVEMYLTAEEIAALLVDRARNAGVTLATAESCTGGLIAGAITSIAGSSDVMEGGIVSYSNDVKMQVLGVQEETLNEFGAVSEQTACQMAVGACKRTGADMAVSVTGIAGPGGGTPEKPVGTVWIGLATKDGVRAELHQFDGTRDEVRERTVVTALTMMCEAISAS